MPRRPPLVHTRDVNWVIVSSSNVHSALFDFEEEELYVRFLRSGPDDIYRYPRRTSSEWVGFQNSKSKGAWIWNNPIGENWPFELLTQRDWSDVDPQEVHPTVRDFAIRRS